MKERHVYGSIRLATFRVEPRWPVPWGASDGGAGSVLSQATVTTVAATSTCGAYPMAVRRHGMGTEEGCRGGRRYGNAIGKLDPTWPTLLLPQQ